VIGLRNLKNVLSKILKLNLTNNLIQLSAFGKAMWVCLQKNKTDSFKLSLKYIFAKVVVGTTD